MAVLFHDVRRLGLVSAGWYYIDRLVSRLTRGGCRILPVGFYALRVRDDNLVQEFDQNTIRVSTLEPSSVRESEFGRPEGVVAERFRSGHICIGACRGQKLLGFMWLSMDTVAERLVRCVFEPFPVGRVAWDYDFFIAPSHRLSRIFARLWDAANERLRVMGIQSTVSWIALSNRDSIRAHQRLGAKRVGWAIFVTAWGSQITVCSMRPFAHWLVPNGDPVRLRVNGRIPRS